MRVSQARPMSSKSLGIVLLWFLPSVVLCQTVFIQGQQAPLNSTDDFLLPLTFGTGDGVRTVLLNPSLSHPDTFVMGPLTCTPDGEDSPKPGCVTYRGGVYDPKASGTYQVEKNQQLFYQNRAYQNFAKGPFGSDNLVIGVDGDTKQKLPDYVFGVSERSNMTSGMLGLGKGSAMLERLVHDGIIKSRSFGLHVGIDIWRHPYGVWNPSFDNSALSQENYSSGSGKRATDPYRTTCSQCHNFRRLKRQDAHVYAYEGIEKRESHKYPASLIFGGYDKAKIDKDSIPLQGPIADDGSLKLEVTSIVFQNYLPNSPFELIKKTWPAVIDLNTPNLVLPQSAVWEVLTEYNGATYGEPRVDFFYANEKQEQRLGNLTFTINIPGKSDKKIDVVLPPTVLYQPIGYLRDFAPVGNEDGYNYSMPVTIFNDVDRKTSQPIVLGRAFLKAAYLFVNHDTSNFQISQVAFKNSTAQIVPIAANQDPSSNDIPGQGGVGKNDGVSGSGNGPPGRHLSVPRLAAVLGCTIILIAALIGILVFLRKRKLRKGGVQRNEPETKPQQPPPAPSPIPGGRIEMDGNACAVPLHDLRPGTAVTTNSMQTVHTINTAGGPVAYLNELPNDEKKFANGEGYKQVPMPTPPPAYQGNYHEMPSQEGYRHELYQGTQSHPSPLLPPSPYNSQGHWTTPQVHGNTNTSGQQQSQQNRWEAGPVPGRYEMM